MSQHLRLIVSCCLWVATAAAGAASVSPDEAVMTALNLRSGYNSAARPPPDDGTANVIYTFVYLSSLANVDSSTEEIKLQVWIDLQWTDSRLSWLGQFNSSLDRVQLILAPSSLMWQPDVSFYDILKVKRISSDNVLVGVNSTGTVHLTYQLLVTSKCKMQLLKFPFDSQSCNSSIASMMQNSDTLKLRVNTLQNPDISAITSYLTKNGEFCISHADLQLNSELAYDYTVFTVSFTRMPVFYVMNLILPSILLLAISTLTFQLPPECEERVSFSITIVLSMCVFLQLTGNYTPTQSDTVPMITCYYSLAVVMTMACVLGNVFVLKCHFRHRTETRVSNRIIRTLFLNRFSTGRWRVCGDSPDSAQIPGTNGAYSCESSQTAGGASDQADSQVNAAAAAKAAAATNEWTVAAEAADKCFFAFFFGVTVAIVAALVVIHATMPHVECLHGSGS